MQCKRCKTFFKYDKYDGICPQCAYFNRPPGMEEVDLFEDDKRFQTENYVLPQMEGIHMELHKKYDSDKKLHKKKKTGKYGNKKRCCKQQSAYHCLPDRGDYSYIISDF